MSYSRKSKKASSKSKGSKICPEGKAWAQRTFDTYPSAYANLAASKYCKDPNYAKKAKGGKRKGRQMGELKDWLKQDWVRIDSSGNIKGPCGTSKDKKNPDRCLPRAKAQSLTKAERAATARKKKSEGKKGKTVVANTKEAKVQNLGGGGIVARGCGAILPDRKKYTSGSVSKTYQESKMSNSRVNLGAGGFQKTTKKKPKKNGNKMKAKGMAKGGAVKKMMKGGAVKKMAKGGPVKKMMKGGPVKKMKNGGAVKKKGMAKGGAVKKMKRGGKVTK